MILEEFLATCIRRDEEAGIFKSVRMKCLQYSSRYLILPVTVEFLD